MLKWYLVNSICIFHKLATLAEWKCYHLASGPELWNLGEVFCHDGVQPYWTPELQWGMQGTKKIKSGSLALEEEPIAAVSQLFASSGHVLKVMIPRPRRHMSCVDATVLVVYAAYLEGT